jgi:iron complex transport system ATP-binding protein
MVMVTHHVEEIPAGFTHALLLRDGKTVAQGRLVDTLTSANLSATYGMPIQLFAQDGRWTARSV